MSLKRREFINYTLGSILFFALPQKSYSTLPDLSQKKFKRLSHDAYHSTTIEGSWNLLEIEGEIPSEINGRFIKIGPGNKETFGKTLNHFFDGDAYISSFDVSPNHANLSSLFLKSPHRMDEQLNKKMLYHEFGTQCDDKKNKGRKNQPNINFIPFNNSLLALSEGGHPLQIDSQSFDALGIYNFSNSLPKNISFTAHPKFDSLKKEWFCFGITQGLSKALNVFKINNKSGKLEELYSINQKNVFMIHDMIMTENYLIFVIPPAYFKISDIIFGKKPMSETLEFDKNSKTNILILPKDPSKEKIELSIPAHLVFHHGNAYEENNQIKFQTFLTNDESLLKLINEWQFEEVRKAQLPSLYNVTVDLKSEKIISMVQVLENHDFPIYNPNWHMKRNRFLYAAEMENKNDPMAFSAITKIDLENHSTIILKMKDAEVCGEPFFVPASDKILEDDGFIAYQGFNQTRNESFLEICGARDLSRLARIWAGRYLPLGFHGHYLPN